ncbi:glutamate racemase [Alloscardovia omnicolens]|uniref:glutamate racemase n=1 Tax=Alloscardovia omnicolens TaxID=419015 RepID=UPI000C75B664|nr:glutamate racemase [Alloscardovia omnicolens]PKY79140.1 glutamate racemase [Alloscardovia omnicolens]
MTSNAPIGIFDSGLGGISVAKEIHTLMPSENLIFYGDSANAPYGVRSTEDVQALSMRIADDFIARGAKAIVIACNTATSAAAQLMRSTYDIPIIGMEPALKLACDLGGGKPQHVIVTATELTLREKKFAALMHRFSATHTIEKQPCPALVDIIENGQFEDAEVVNKTLRGYLDAYDLDSVNSIVLGCTHFTYYRDYFRALVPQHVRIVDGNEGTARHVRDVLAERDELASNNNEGTIILLNSSDDPRMMELSNYFWSL